MNIWPSYSQPESLGLWCSRDMVVFKGSPGEPSVKHGESINLVTFKTPQFIAIYTEQVHECPSLDFVFINYLSVTSVISTKFSLMSLK